MPNVSVIMPVYNMADTPLLQTAVDSIKSQTYEDWELIICNDGSTDHTAQVLERIASSDKRIRVIHQKQNHGAGHARNTCIRASAGKYIALMDADDISAPGRLEKQAAFLDQHAEYAFVGCNVNMIGSDGKWGERILEERPVRESFLYTMPFVHPSVMLRRDVIEQMHGYSQSRRVLRVEDYELFMRMYADGYQGYNMQEILYSYREDMDSYKRRRYRYRIDECRVRCVRFRDMGILRGNLRHAVKPLVAGAVPACVMRMIKAKRYQKKRHMK